ncbi:MAG: Spy/CpxP family protein refolding chaperone [candidate division WOR-3 bacterium]|nr:Spy/CpxP family protein refolding chaperone [candidate division WOR-3 bacterium]
MINRFSRDVNLTDEQEAAINKIKDEILAKQKEAREEARKNRDKLKNEIITLVKSDKIDKEQIQKILRNEEVIREKREMDDFLAEKLLQIHDLLTPEQREKIAKKIENFKVKNRNEKN